MNDETMFLRALQTKPNDRVTRFVYADWLEEQGGPDELSRAAFLRAEAEWGALLEEDEGRPALEERLRELAEGLSAGWLAVVGRRKIENCEVRFAFRCPKLWEELEPMAADAMRFCPGCRKEVHFCDTLETAREHAGRGHCIAIGPAVRRAAGDMVPWLSEDEDTLEMGEVGLMDYVALGEEGPAPPSPPAPARRSWWSRLFGWRG